ASGDATLASVEVDGIPLAGFDPDSLAYEVVLPASVVAVPEVTATASDENASVQVQQATLITGDEEERTANILVTAQDPAVTLEYTVTFRYIGTDASLAAILLDGEPMEEFEPETEMYHLTIPSFDDFPIIEASPADENASVAISDPESSTGGDVVFMLVHILVTAEDNETTRDYYLQFRELSSNALLSMIWIDEELLEDFDSEIFDYTLDWDYGDGSLPVVEAMPQSEDAQVLVTQVVSLDGTVEERTAEILVIAENGETTHTYTVFFDVFTNIHHASEATLMKVYPNPASHTLTISTQSKAGILTITNALGMEMLRIKKPQEYNTIDISQYPSGMYFVRMIDKTEAIVETGIFIKK
ncbi:MAG: T9SS C-terminal target domain-containing protein, partial [Bacteroidetes bacterium]